MNWLARFKPGDKSLAKADSIPVVYTADNASWEIRHGQWSHETSFGYAVVGGTMVEDVFINPDTTSPIGGVMVERTVSDDLSYHSLYVSAIYRAGQADEGEHLLRAHDLMTWRSPYLFDWTMEGIRALGLEPEKKFERMAYKDASDLSIPDAKEYFSARIPKIMDTLLNKEVLSKNPEIRQAFVAAIRNTFHSIQNTKGFLEPGQPLLGEGR